MCNITLQYISGNGCYLIQDLGLSVSSEAPNLVSNLFSVQSLLDSQDLESSVLNGNVEIRKDGNLVQNLSQLCSGSGSVSQNKFTLEWTGYLDSNGVSASSYLNTYSDQSTQTSPFIAPFDCVIKTIVTSGGLLNQPYLLEIRVNGVLLTSYQRSGASLANIFKNLSIQISEGSNVSLRMVYQGLIVRRPFSSLYLEEL
jgi:hypothetical protein